TTIARRHARKVRDGRIRAGRNAIRSGEGVRPARRRLRRRELPLRSFRQKFYFCSEFINLLLNLRHAFHLHVEFLVNGFDVTVDFGDKRAALGWSRFAAFAGCARYSPRAWGSPRSGGPPSAGLAVLTVVGWGTGAVIRRLLLGRVRGFPLRARVGATVIPFPFPAASHAACGFAALRAPA